MAFLHIRCVTLKIHRPKTVKSHAISTGCSGQTFLTLTTGIDVSGSLVGSAGTTSTVGNDTFVALVDDSAVPVGTTLTALDSIDGGAGQDVLNLNVLTITGGFKAAKVAGIETVNIRSAVDLTKADTSKWTGVETINVTQGEVLDLTVGDGQAVNVDGISSTKSITVTGTTGAVNVVGVDNDVDVTTTTGDVTVTTDADVTVEATTGNVDVEATTGKADVTGGTDVTVSANGDITLTGVIGAIKVTNTDQAATAIDVNGGTTVNVTAAGNTGGTIDVGQGGAAADLPTGAVTISSTAAAYDGKANTALGAITVDGGSSVTVTQSANITPAQVTAALTSAANKTVTQGAISVTGGDSTFDVTVTQDAAVVLAQYAALTTDGKIGVVAGNVTIADVNAGDATKAGMISVVTLNNYGNSTVDSSALSTVNLSGTGGTLGLSRGALTATPTANTLALNVTSLTAGAITDAEAASDDGFKTINLYATGTASKIANLDAADATTLNVTGSAAVELTNYSMAGLTAVTVADGGLALKTATLPVGASFTSGAGVDSVIVGATTKAISTGAGNDTVTLASGTSAITGTIDGGDGTADTLDFANTDDAATASATATFAAQISGFERLSLAAITASKEVKLNNLDNINYVKVAGVASGQTLTLSGGATDMTVVANDGAVGTIAVTYTTGATGTSDVLNLNVANKTAQTIGTLSATDIETIKINTGDTSTVSTNLPIAHAITTLTAAKATSVTVAGNAGLSLGSGFSATTVTNFDASGVTKGDVTWTTGLLAAPATIKGGAGNDTLDATGAIAGVTLSGNDGNDVLTGSAAIDFINGGNGDDVLTGGAKADNLTGGAGSDVFYVASGSATDSNGANTDTITDFTSGTDYISISNTIAVKYAGAVNNYGTVLTALSGTVKTAVVDSSTNTLYIDVDNSGTLTNADIAINLNTSTLTQLDFAVKGSAGADTLSQSTVSTYGVTVLGLAGDDTITGGSYIGGDLLKGGAGNDSITGGAGADTIDGGEGVLDTVSYADVTTATDHSLTNVAGIAVNLSAAAVSAATINTAMGGTIVLGGGQAVAGADLAAGSAGYLAATAAQSTTTMVRDTISNVENVTGSSLADYIVGSSGDNVIIGGAGADVMTGGLGVDTFGFAGSASHTASTDDNNVITDFTGGTGGDKIAFGTNTAFAHGVAALTAFASGAKADVGATVGMQVFSDDITVASSTTGPTAAELQAYLGATKVFGTSGADSAVYLIVDNGTDSWLLELQNDGANQVFTSAADGMVVIAKLTGVADATTITAANFTNFS